MTVTNADVKAVQNLGGRKLTPLEFARDVLTVLDRAEYKGDLVLGFVRNQAALQIEQAAGSKLNDFQKVAAKAYGDGDFAWMADEQGDVDFRNVGDTVFTSLMTELSDKEDCTDWGTAVTRTNRMAMDIRNALDALIDDPRNVDPETDYDTLAQRTVAEKTHD